MAAPKIRVNTDASPTAAITKNNEAETIPAGKLSVTLKKPGILSQYRIVEVVGESAKNSVYMGMIMPLLWVTEIDGLPQPAPTTKRELEALIQRLGEDGVDAIMSHIMAMSGATEPLVETVKN